VFLKLNTQISDFICTVFPSLNANYYNLSQRQTVEVMQYDKLAMSINLWPFRIFNMRQDPFLHDVSFNEKY